MVPSHEYISRTKELAINYFDIIKDCSIDEGLSVRKRAVKVLWECCVQCPCFPRMIEAVVLIMNRAADPEESMRKLASSICTDLWFLPGSLEDSGSALASTIDRSAKARAIQLAEVCMTSHQMIGGQPHTLPGPDSSLTSLLSSILNSGPNQKTLHETPVREGARQLISALVDWYLELHDTAIVDPLGSEKLQMSCLRALHALVSVDINLSVPQEDPARYVRSLAPYLKEKAEGSGDNEARRFFFRLQCILYVLDSACRSLDYLDPVIAEKMASDLEALVSKSPYIKIVAGAIQCLCNLVRLCPNAVPRIQRIVTKLFSRLDGDLSAGTTATTRWRSSYSRFLLIIGHFCRHGPKVIDSLSEVRSEDSFGAATTSHNSGLNSGLSSSMGLPGASSLPGAYSIQLSTAQCLTLFLGYYSLDESKGGGSKLRDSAMQAMGMLFTSRPDLMLDNTAVLPLLEEVLAPSSCATADIKCRVLGNLVELLRVEEESMKERQAQAEKAQHQSKLASTLPATEPAPLARINGEGDSGSITSSVVQRLWPLVLQLAKDVPLKATAAGLTIGSNNTNALEEASTPGARGGGDFGVLVRRYVLDLIEIVQRGGLTAPWQAVAPLVALITDPCSSTADKAIRALKQVVDKHLEYVGPELQPGLIHAYNLQKQLWQAQHGVAQPFGKGNLPVTVVEQLGAFWTQLIQPVAALKSKLLSSLLRPFDDATNTAGPGALTSDPGLLWFLSWLSVHLPYRKMDEPLLLLSTVSSLISRRGEACMVELKDAIAAEQLSRKQKKNGDGISASNNESVNTSNERENNDNHGGQNLGAAAAMITSISASSDEAFAAAAAAAAAAAINFEPVACNTNEQLGKAGSNSWDAAVSPSVTPFQVNDGALLLTLKDGGDDGSKTSSLIPKHGMGIGSTTLSTPATGPSLTSVKAAFVSGMSNRLVAAIKANLAVSLLLLIKHYLLKAYRLQEDRVIAFLSGPKKAEEKKLSAVKDTNIALPRLDVLYLEAFHDLSLKEADQTFKTVKHLLNEDSKISSSSSLFLNGVAIATNEILQHVNGAPNTIETHCLEGSVGGSTVAGAMGTTSRSGAAGRTPKDGNSNRKNQQPHRGSQCLSKGKRGSKGRQESAGGTRTSKKRKASVTSDEEDDDNMMHHDDDDSDEQRKLSKAKRRLSSMLA